MESASRFASLPGLTSLPKDGYLVLPISMSRIPNRQSARGCIEILDYFSQTYELHDVDIVILYTDGLYGNDENTTALASRKKLTSQMLSHKNALSRLIGRSKNFPPHAVHYISWDHTVLNNAKDYLRFTQTLQQRAKADRAFQEVLTYSIGNRVVNEARRSFLIEETVVTHMIRQHLIALPKTRVQRDTFRLVVYPGPFIAIDFYQWKHRVLPQRRHKDFYASQYNVADKVLYNFDSMELPESLDDWPRELHTYASEPGTIHA